MRYVAVPPDWAALRDARMRVRTAGMHTGHNQQAAEAYGEAAALIDARYPHAEACTSCTRTCA